MIVHPIFTLLGLNDGNATIGEGLVVILLYIALGMTALAIDRRALLVSALAYVLFALNELFRQFGAVELNVALTALVIGSALLLLSAFWHQARAMVVKPLPDRSASAAAADSTGRWLVPHQPHKPALERGQDQRKVVAPLEHRTMFRRLTQTPLASPEARGVFQSRSRAARRRGERRRSWPRRRRSAWRNRASGRRRPCARTGRGCG